MRPAADDADCGAELRSGSLRESDANRLGRCRALQFGFILPGVVFGILMLAIKVQAQPALNLQLPSTTNLNLRLAWPAPSSGFSLEEAETLEGSPLWQTAGALPIVDSHGWLYAGPLTPIAELDATGTVVSRFVFADQSGAPDYLIRDGRTYRFITDSLGSPRLIVDVDSGAIAQRLDYDEWGRVIADTNPGFHPFGFAGGLYDSATALVRFGVRDYDPEAGRWTSKDPIGFGGSLGNLYAYVANDPVNNVDLEGTTILGVDVGSARLANEKAQDAILGNYNDAATQSGLKANDQARNDRVKETGGVVLTAAQLEVQLYTGMAGFARPPVGAVPPPPTYATGPALKPTDTRGPRPSIPAAENWNRARGPGTPNYPFDPVTGKYIGNVAPSTPGLPPGSGMIGWQGSGMSPRPGVGSVSGL